MTEDLHDNNKFLEEAVEQFVDAQLQGKEPVIDEFVKKYPDFEHQVRKRIRKLRKIDTLFASLVKPDEGDFEDTAADQNLVGEKVGSFEIVEIIGRGGMGVVYLARDTKLKRSVAIKSMPAKLTGDSNSRGRFRREAELLASLNHPNIAVIHDIIEPDDHSSYLVLENVPGETLSERMKRKTLTMDEVLSIGRQIAEAVSAAHEKSIVHRDLKPGNIKITPEGRVKVLDFGLAKISISESKNGESTITHPGRVIGTPAYMSPEQARGKPTDHRTDIWSFGCIMYQMLTGHLPFEGETATDTLARIIERQPDWDLLPENTPANIRMLLRCCLEKDQDKRLDNMTDATVQISNALSKPLTAPAVSTRSRRAMWMVGAVIIIVLLAVTLHFLPEKQAQSSLKEIRLVVLPFENPGPVEAEWFADTMTDEITTRLVGIRPLAVIARQSAFAYKNKKMPTRQIAKELNIDYVVTGTVQCEFPSDPNETARELPPDPNTPVRIRVQLIKAADDKVEWADSYDGDMYEVLTFQSHIAEQVAKALDIALLEPERQTLAFKPTENPDAYAYYMRGKEYYSLGWEDNIKRAIQMFERAIKLDPNYARAYAALSRAHTSMYWVYYDRSEERLVKAEKAARRALELDRDLPEANKALGLYYYHGRFDYDSAYEQFEIVRKNFPNAAGILFWIGAAQSRQAKFEEALVNLKRAYELDPASTSLPDMIAHALRFLRRYEEEQRYLDRLISLAPDMPRIYVKKAESCLLWHGDIEGARANLEDARANTSETAGGFFLIHDLDITLDIFNRDYPEALNKLLSKPRDFDNMVWFIPNDLRLAEVYRYLGNEQLAQQYYKSAVAILEEKVAEVPNDCRFHSALGKAYAGLGGREQDAVDEGKLGVKYRPVEKDAHNGPLQLDDLARIYVMVGKYDEAIDILQRLLSMPSELTVPWLRLDPVWDPLRNHPRFEKLIESDK